MTFDLSERTAIVTGGGSGIGKAISKTLLEHGARVIILELNQDSITSAEREFEKGGLQIKGYVCNVADHQKVKKTIDSIASNENIDILVNNAGIAHVGNIEGTTEGDLDKLYNINIKGVYNCMYAAIPHMKNKGGVILNLASIASSVGITDRFAYSMTKGAVLTMTYSVAKDYIKYGIRCNTISPARIHTPFVDAFIKANYPGKENEMLEKLSKTQPIGRMGNPQEVASLALYLCSKEASFVTGTDFPIDGGFIKLNGQ